MGALTFLIIASLLSVVSVIVGCLVIILGFAGSPGVLLPGLFTFVIGGVGCAIFLSDLVQHIKLRRRLVKLYGRDILK